MKRHIAIRFCFWLILTTNTSAQVAEIPDPSLREAIKEALGIPAGNQSNSTT